MNNLENEVVKINKDTKINLTTELGSGGQGAVYKTTNNGIAVKMKFNKDGGIEFNDEEYNIYRQRIESILIIPDIEDINICTPKSLLEKPHCGYVMELLNDLKPVSSIFKKDGEDFLENYRRTGGYKKRIEILLELARTLNRLHASGLTYGDISHNNIFISLEEGYSKVWLIDCDNLTTNEIYKNGFYTPGYEAPELAKGIGHCTRHSDSYSFAVLAYKILLTRSPFEYIEDEDDGWSKSSTLDNSNYVAKQYISNTFNENFKYLIPSKLNDMFINTFSEESNLLPFNRPSMAEWCDLLTEIYNNVFECNCTENDNFSFSILDDINECPWCKKRISPICEIDLSIIGKSVFNQEDIEFVSLKETKYIKEGTFKIYNNYILNTNMVDNFPSTKYPESLLRFNIENNDLIITKLYKSGELYYINNEKLTKLPDKLVVEKGERKLIVLEKGLEFKKILFVRY